MPSVQHLGRSEICERELFSLALPDLRSMPDSIALPTRHFVAFLAADGIGVSAAEFATFSRKLIRAGCAYFCAWGADCERMHDIFDDECLNVEPVIMTTWHSEDSLDEALWFFVSSAYPDDASRNTCGSALALSIGRQDWDDDIRSRLSDIHSLTRDVVDGV